MKYLIKFLLAPKYCGFVKDEGGIELINALLENEEVGGELKKLAKITLENVKSWESKQSRKLGLEKK